MGGSSSSSTETSQTSYPQWTQDAQANTYSTGKGMLENFLRNPQYQVAGLSSDTLKGMDFARTSARNVFETPRGSVPGAGGNLTAQMGTAAQGNAAQLTPGGYKPFMNPYIEDVVNTSRDAINRDYMDKSAGLSAKYAAGNAFGGSSEALAQGQLARGANETLAATTAALMSQGFSQAQAAALANAQMLQQASMQNAGFKQQTGLANQQAENAMRALGLDYGLKGAQVNDQLRTSQLAREQTALERLLQGGQLQENKSQQALDIPWTALQRLMALTPQQMNSQTVKQGQSEKQESAASTFGSIASGLGSLGIKFSDARMKTDIRMIGALPNGLGVYDYAWRADGVREIGLIAQEVQRTNPDAVIEAPNGMLMVDYGKAVGGA